MTADPDPTLIFEWCRDVDLAETVATFFVAHADAAYISHSELQFGRATAVGAWSDELHAKVASEATAAIANTIAATTIGPRLALALQDGTIAGLAFVSFRPDAPTPFAVLDDIIVAPSSRGQGLGRAFLAWITEACRQGGMKRLFLESGGDNHGAHAFFARDGFVPTSVVMMRTL